MLRPSSSTTDHRPASLGTIENTEKSRRFTTLLLLLAPYSPCLRGAIEGYEGAGGGPLVQT
jgi:hypothetical protein